MENFSRSAWALLAWRQALRNAIDKWFNLLLLTCLGVIYQFQVCFIWASFCGICLYPIYCVFMSLKPDTDIKPAGTCFWAPSGVFPRLSLWQIQNLFMLKLYYACGQNA